MDVAALDQLGAIRLRIRLRSLHDRLPSGRRARHSRLQNLSRPGVYQGTPLDCVGCHGGGSRIRATARPTNHVFSTETYEDCHRTSAWVPLVEMNHDAIFGSCSTCHNNIPSIGKPLNHPPTQQECDTCHTRNFWSPLIFDHQSATYPGDHARNPTCTDFHTTNSQTVPWPTLACAPDCAACHAADYKTGPHRGASVSTLGDCAGARHKPNPQHSVRDRGW